MKQRISFSSQSLVALALSLLTAGCSPDPDHPKGIMFETALGELDACEFRAVHTHSMFLLGDDDWDVYAVCSSGSENTNLREFYHLVSIFRFDGVELDLSDPRSLAACSPEEQELVEKRIERLRRERFSNEPAPLFNAAIVREPCPPGT